LPLYKVLKQTARHEAHITYKSRRPEEGRKGKSLKVNKQKLISEAFVLVVAIVLMHLLEHLGMLAEPRCKISVSLACVVPLYHVVLMECPLFLAS
jgi:hypothetical protein